MASARTTLLTASPHTMGRTVSARAADEARDNDDPFQGLALGLAGRSADASALLVDLHARYGSNQVWAAYINLMQAFTRGHAKQIVAAADACLRLPFGDPEGLFYIGVVLARSEQPARALVALRRTVDAGFSCPAALNDEPLKGLCGSPEFDALRSEAERRHRRAADAFDLGVATHC
jgi:hypothetical protein